jgi:hypothetical protein
MNVCGSLSAFAMGGVMLAALAGTAQAQGGMAGSGTGLGGAAESNLIRVAHEHGGWDHGREGRILEFNDLAFGTPAPYELAYDGGGCRFYRMKWHQTGRRYWLRRYEDCREG